MASHVGQTPATVETKQPPEFTLKQVVLHVALSDRQAMAAEDAEPEARSFSVRFNRRSPVSLQNKHPVALRQSCRQRSGMVISMTKHSCTWGIFGLWVQFFGGF